MTPVVAFLAGVLALGAPLAALLWVAHHAWTGRLAAGLTLVGLGGLTLTVFVAAPWSFTSVYLRYALPLAFAPAALTALRRPLDTGFRPRRREALLAAALAVPGLALTGVTLRGFTHRSPAAELAFPLRQGAYVVLQGGDSPLMNPFHRADSSERFAVDLAKLNRWGGRARRPIPSRLQDYEIFGEVVYAPCSGTVAEANDGLPDNPPGTADAAQPAGNSVLLQCRGFWVLLAHLQNGSVRVHPGDLVSSTVPIGRVGNSGNTSEPHMHLQAMRTRDGEAPLRDAPVPMRFKGRFLTINQVWRAQDPLTHPSPPVHTRPAILRPRRAPCRSRSSSPPSTPRPPASTRSVRRSSWPARPAAR